MTLCAFFMLLHVASCSKRDIPVSNYRTHTLHCQRSNLPLTKCTDCDAMVSQDTVEQHRREAHTLRVCDLCHISVEAFKMPEHMVGRNR